MGRPGSEFGLRVLREGTPVALGVITTTGAADVKTNANTAAPFTIAPGKLLRLVSDVACVINVGTTGVSAATATSSANYGMPLAAGAPLFLLTPDNVTPCLIAAVGGAAVNLNVAVMS